MTPRYRQPWEHGAKAYPEADDLSALAEGVRRKRKPLTVHVRTSAVADLPCAGCGCALGGPYPLNPGTSSEKQVEPGEWTYADVSPRRGTAVLRHYYCAWGATMNEVVRLSRLVAS